MKKNALPGFVVAAVVVFVASFMPWGSMRGSPSSPFTGGMFPGGNPFGGLQMTFTINAWSGHATLLGITVPNWVVVAAAAIAVIAVLGSTRAWNADPLINIALAIYGTLHLGLIVFILGSKGSLGIGSILTLICFLGLLFLSIKAAREPSSQGAEAVEA
jgi:hypothetical protein